MGEIPTLCGGDHRRVDGSERKVTVDGNKLCDPEPVGGTDMLGEEISRSEVTEESDLGVRSQSGLDKVRNLGDDEHRNNEWAGMLLEQSKAFVMVAIVSVDVGI